MTVTFTLNSAYLGTEAGPFNISGTTNSNVVTQIVVNASLEDLIGGITMSGIDDDTISFTIESVGTCTTFVTKLVSSNVPYVPCTDGMDVVFLVDYTGSMSGAIEGVKSSIANIASTIVTESNNNYRLGLVIFDEYMSGTNSNYDDKIDYTSLPSSQRYINTGLNGYYQWITAVEMMSSNNQTSFTTQLNKINNPSTFPLGSGEGAPEPSDMGVDLVGLQNFAGSFRNNVARLVVLITDATPSGNDDTYNSTDIAFVNGLTPQLVNQGVRVLLMTTAGTNVLYDLATGTNGVVSSGFSGADIITAIEDVCVPAPTPTPSPTSTSGSANSDFVAVGSNRSIACNPVTNPSITVYYSAADWDSLQIGDVLYNSNDLTTPVNDNYYYNIVASTGREVVRMLGGVITAITDCDGNSL